MFAKVNPMLSCPNRGDTGIDTTSDEQDSVNTPNGTNVETEERKHIRLYPCRFGVFRTHPVEGEIIRYLSDYAINADCISTNIDTFSEKNRIEALHDMDNNEKYFYYPMPLRSGWLYMRDENGDRVYEFSHNNFHFTLSRLIDSDNKVLSEANEKCTAIIKKEHTQAYITLPNSFGVYLFFSEFQVSADHIRNNFLNVTGCPKGAKAFSAKKWRESNGFSETDIEMGCLDTHDAVMFYMPLQGGLESTQIDAHKNILRNAAINNLEKPDHRDVIVAVYDPLGITDQIAKDLRDSQLEHESILRSIRIGIDPKHIKDRLLNIAQNDDLTPISDERLCSHDKSNLIQIQLMHSIAVSLYQMAYAKDSPHKKANHSIDEERLLRFLAVKERKDAREAIENLRYTLAESIRSPLYKAYCHFFAEAVIDNGKATDEEKIEHAEMLLNSRLAAIRAYMCLSATSTVNDSYIDVVKDKEVPYEDPHAGLLMSVIEKSDDNHVGKLFSQQSDIAALGHDVEEIGVSSDGSEVRYSFSKLPEVALLFDSIINTWWRIALQADKTKLVVDFLEKVGAEESFTILQSEVNKRLNVQNLKLANSKGVFQKAGKGKWKINRNYVNINKNTININTIWAKPGSTHLAAKALSQSPRYLGVLSLVTIVSIGSYLKSISKDSIISQVLHSTELLSTITALQRRFVESRLTVNVGTKALRTNRAAIMGIQQQIRVLGIIGVVAGIADSSVRAWSRGFADLDAALCYWGAAAVGAGSLIASIFVSASAAGIIGIIAAAVIVGLYFLADWFTDTDLEIFIKKTVFTNKTPDTLKQPYNCGTKAPWEVVSELSQKKWRVSYANNDIVSDYEYMLEEFLNQHCMIPHVKLSASYNIPLSISATGSDIPVDFNLALSVDMGRYANVADEVEIKTFYVIKNIWNDSTPINFSDSIPSSPYEISQSFHINKYQDFARYFKRTNVCIVVMLKLKDINGRTVPFDRKANEDSYLIYQYQLKVPRKYNWSRGKTEYNYHGMEAVLNKVIVENEKKGLKV